MKKMNEIFDLLLKDGLTGLTDSQNILSKE